MTDSTGGQQINETGLEHLLSRHKEGNPESLRLLPRLCQELLLHPSPYLLHRLQEVQGIKCRFNDINKKMITKKVGQYLQSCSGYLA